MNPNHPAPEILDAARSMLVVAANVVTTDDPPSIDWTDDRDVCTAFVISAAIGLAEQLERRDDLASGLVSGRFSLAVREDGAWLLERPVDLLADGI